MRIPQELSTPYAKVPITLCTTCGVKKFNVEAALHLSMVAIMWMEKSETFPLSAQASQSIFDARDEETLQQS
jgi:hypothetical protein